jgi:glutathione peroxidase
MRSAVVVLSVFTGAVLGACSRPPAEQAPAASEENTEAKTRPDQTNDVIVDHTVQTLEGETKKLSDYRGKALLIVNTASECGYTPQYADLQQVYAKYREQGFEVLAFPSNDFGGQEPGQPEEIREFVDDAFSVTFPIFDKVHAKGPEQSPLYKTLTEDTAEGIKGEVKWNFTKFIVDPQGKVVARFEPPVKPTDREVTTTIEKVLPRG